MISEVAKVLHVVLKDMSQNDHRAFYTFMEAEDILPWRSMRSGGGAWDGLFEASDANKVLAWLKENTKHE